MKTTRSFGISLLQPLLAVATRAVAHATTAGGTLPYIGHRITRSAGL